MVFDSDNSRTEERRDGRRDELPRRSLRGHDDGLTPLWMPSRGEAHEERARPSRRRRTPEPRTFGPHRSPALMKSPMIPRGKDAATDMPADGEQRGTPGRTPRSDEAPRRFSEDVVEQLRGEPRRPTPETETPDETPTETPTETTTETTGEPAITKNTESGAAAEASPATTAELPSTGHSETTETTETTETAGDPAPAASDSAEADATGAAPDDEAENRRLRGRIETLEGQLSALRKSHASVIRAQKAAREREADFARLQEKCEALQMLALDRDRLKQEQVRLADETSALDASRAELEAQRREHQETLARLEAARQDTEDARRALERERESVAAEREAILEERRAFEAARRAAGTRRVDRELDRLALWEERRSLDADRAALRREARALALRRSELNAAWLALQTRRQELESGADERRERERTSSLMKRSHSRLVSRLDRLEDLGRSREDELRRLGDTLGDRFGTRLTELESRLREQLDKAVAASARSAPARLRSTAPAPRPPMVEARPQTRRETRVPKGPPRPPGGGILAGLVKANIDIRSES